MTFRISEEGLKKIDELRGQWSRSEYVRQALHQAVLSKITGPEKTKL